MEKVPIEKNHQEIKQPTITRVRGEREKAAEKKDKTLIRKVVKDKELMELTLAKGGTGTPDEYHCRYPKGYHIPPYP
ncbi:hypothetical protein RUM43_005328 [Polyplax serrata]|uniref:Uncharacterized protein n=1 Tax=Polyplax serrata TaxID=468196 RepID=A0AAN8NQ08_POLSC